MRPRYSVAHAGAAADPTADRAAVTVIKLAWCCLLASVVAAALMFPLVGGFGLLSNRASDVGRQRLGAASSRATCRRCRRWSTRQGNADRVAVLAAPVRGAQRPDRQHDEAGDRLDRGQAVRRAQRRGLAGHADRPVRLPVRQPRHPRRLDHRAAVREELSAAGDRRRPTPRSAPPSRPRRRASCARSGWR